MASMKGNTQYIGLTGALAGGGAGSIWTYNHTQGKKAKMISVLNTEGQALPPTVVAVTQPSVSQIVVTAIGAQPGGVMVRAEWDVYSAADAAALPGSVGTIS